MTTPSVLTIPVDLGGIWHYGWAFGLLACLAMGFSRRRDWLNPATVLLCYFVGRAVWILEAPLLPFGDYTRAFQATAGQAAIEIVLVYLGARAFVRAFGRTPRLASYLVWFEIFMVWANHAGLLGWESFDCALLALTLPFITARVPIAVALITIFTHHGMTAYLILAAQVLALWPECFPAAIWGAILLGFAHHRGAMLDGLERWHAWTRMMSLWASDSRNYLFGTGPGSFMWISLLRDNFQPPLFLQLHSDWLQILFEDGLVGLGLILGLFISTAVYVRKRRKALALVLGCGAFGLTYHPLRFFPSAFTIMVIFILATGDDIE